MLLVGYYFDIWSERWLREEVHLNLAYRWLCRLDLNGCKTLPQAISENVPKAQMAMVLT